ncbi:YdeI/OmpD-associated family protein [Flavobacterium sp. GCM10027622]|uniref:YdeI/OmpD-associated family protein n=1 Tax=unclassified Flavobacterium TaxID=196869 RepID=UPI0036221E14
MEEKKSWQQNDLWEKEIDFLKAIINTTQLIETTKWGGIVYTINNKNVLGIGGFKSYFGLWFFNGVYLKDEANLLVSGNETTKAQRQLRFNSLDEVDEKLVLNYINEAIQLEEKGVKHKAEKSPLVLSAYFESFLDSNKEIKKAFEAFSLTKKKEFAEYIDTAKQEKTKETRLEKITPLILEGIGLNDKYRK